MTEPKAIDTKTIERWAFVETVDYTEEKFLHNLLSGTGKKAQFEDFSLGWYIRFQGSNESFFISETKPNLHAGDRIRVTLEKL